MADLVSQAGCDCDVCQDARRIQAKMKKEGKDIRRQWYDRDSVQFRRLWRNLSEFQRETLEAYNRVPIRTKKGQLYVMPYSRFHDHTLNGQMVELAHVTLQVFKKKKTSDGDVDVLADHFCAGLDKTHAATNVLAVKLLLEADQALYLEKGHSFHGACGCFEKMMGKSFEETLEIPIDPLRYLSEHA